MYLATRPPPTPVEALPVPDADELPPNPKPVSRNVVMLGLTSFFTDISSEMVAAVLPLYVVFQLGFNPLQLGAFDGVYQGLAAVFCLGAALIADRRRRPKRVAAVGYGLSTLARLGLVVAAGGWVPTLGFLYVDRLGKGVRTAPRDALISLSSTRARLGTAFGVHRALDTAGAVLGPLVAWRLLARNPTGFDVVFVTSFFIAVIGLGVLVLFVDERRVITVPAGDRDDHGDVVGAAVTADPVAVADPGTGAFTEVVVAVDASEPAVAPSLRGAIQLLRERPYRRLCLVAGAIALLTPGDAMLFVALQRRVTLTPTAFTLLYFGASVVFLAAAVPVGLLADRIGRVRVFIAGEVLFIGALAVVGSSVTGTFAAVLTVGFLGTYYAATDGVLMAMASSLVPAPLRTSGLAVVVTALALGHLVASLVFGAVWIRLGPTPAIHLFMAGLAIVVPVGGWVLHRSTRPIRR